MSSQLLMRRPDLSALPVSSPPTGYTLHRCDRRFDDDERIGIAIVLQAAFPESDWSPSRVDATFIGDTTVQMSFYIARDARIVATASARLDAAYPGSGYLHWVAVLPDERGQRLGRLVSVAVMHEFVAIGCPDAVLHTDDFRLPAIRTYLGLGFLPETTDATHEERWAAIREQLSAEPLPGE